MTSISKTELVNVALVFLFVFKVICSSFVDDILCPLILLHIFDPTVAPPFVT